MPVKIDKATFELERIQKEMSDFAELLDARQDEINKQCVLLDEREKKLLKREQELDTAALQDRARMFAEMHRDLQEIRIQELKKIDDELNAKWQKLTEELNQHFATQFEADNAKRAALDEMQRDLQKERERLEFEKIRLKQKEDSLKNRRAEIDSEVESMLDDRHKELQSKLAAAKEQEKKLLDVLKAQEAELATFRNFNAVYGNMPEVLMRKMQDLKDRNAALVEELGRRPGEELQADFVRIEAECKRLTQERIDINNRLSAMQEQLVELQTLQQENTILKATKEHLKGTLNEAQETIDGLQARIDRLTATEITAADRDKRMASLREPYLKNPFNAPQLESKKVAAVDEIVWLDRMMELFKDYGITFPRRILYAFHTSFKIANWSTMTVLAGVSGTGKSELPRLYSAFGGFNFISVPVQPNWDSQESMLGFFNSIDNKFDAQPMLRFLVECTEKYKNNMAIVLLDEMNLAHVEHYFADFLSKLETRRSLPENSEPEIYVNLGAGVKPYGLPLKRNILWCGTMNQDETTKSLSDKVLDRGIVINFPRPRELKSREGERSLTSFCEKAEIAPMNIKLWDSWRARSITLQGDQLNELKSYRHLLETMNEHLSYAGCAIGHRVWQSIEHYVINYPTVRAAIKTAGDELTPELKKAIHTAVEDQIVQKVMTKLRGIETRGNSYDKCLLPIKGLLTDFNLNDDFERACSMGYGQFIWNSAEYIGNDVAQENG